MDEVRILHEAQHEALLVAAGFDDVRVIETGDALENNPLAMTPCNSVTPLHSRT